MHNKEEDAPRDVPLPSGFRPLSATVLKRYELGAVVQDVNAMHNGHLRIVTKKKTGQLLCMKTSSKYFEEDQISYSDFCNELHILKHLARCRGLVHFVDAHEDEGHMHLFVEYCEGGNLLSRLIEAGRLTEAACQQLIRSLLETVAECHARNILIRDIKPENILFPRTSSPISDCRLGNLYHATFMTVNSPSVPDDRRSPLIQWTGSFKAKSSPIKSFSPPPNLLTWIPDFYPAPEVLREQSYGPPSDVWSVGMILYFALVGRPPFQGCITAEELEKAICMEELKFPTETLFEISEEGKHFASRMACKDPTSRASITELFQHPWLNKQMPSLGTEKKSELCDSGISESTRTSAAASIMVVDFGHRSENVGDQSGSHKGKNPLKLVLKALSLSRG
ncbi:hypothetical protein CEUSTIGMA_g143.t1 [Chlamydomonas eustigma]|uniref:Protein kinase domain-containing protein n=1 Tax=Chlamydomonas eustigma TaxID=1157962 RepID=A0A250WPC2_9CHLO|nr:hypothetical protein CEUSTIGMA_g143.t1 [Chlamydomonas eustigma]|eukprot:GAX72687.1 hypothetical protein CEUSTIGMA_g143.t1 [Chlamydomonas eustigma]